jgi:hypothetical protein
MRIAHVIGIPIRAIASFLHRNYVKENFNQLWSSGQSSWLQIQRSGLDSRRYQILREVVGLERGPLSLVSTTEEQLGRKSSGFGLETRKYGRGNPSSLLRGTIYPQRLALTSPTSGGIWVGIVRSRSEATEFSLVCLPQSALRNYYTLR